MLDIPMRRYEKAIFDHELLSAIFDMISIVHVGVFDHEYPYVVPMNFGYKIEKEFLKIYVHCAKEGHKVDLWNKNPNVSATFSTFSNYPDKHYMHTNHDFRSIMARGKIRLIDKKQDPKLFGEGFQLILKHNHRQPNDFSVPHMMFMDLYLIECDWNHVVGKSENPVRTLEDVFFPDVYNLPFNDERHDYTDLFTRKIEEAFEKARKGEKEC